MILRVVRRIFARKSVGLLRGAWPVGFLLAFAAFATTPARAQTVTPLPDTGSSVAGVNSTPIANVAGNDTINSDPATLGSSGNAVVSQFGNWPDGIALDPDSGAVSTSATVPPGTYNLQYQLCDVLSPPDCASTTDTVTITASIVANPDTGSATAGTGSTPIANVAANDTVNGAPATLGSPGNATVAQMGAWPNGVTLDPNSGAISTTAAAAPGTYGLQYQLCDVLSPPDCASTTDTVTVSASIVASPESGTGTSGTASTPIANVSANDSVNGSPATLGSSGNATVAQFGSWPSGVTLDANTGAISMSATAAPGTYGLQYQLCDLSAPPNCATATDTLTISVPVVTVVANPESGTADFGVQSTVIAHVNTNDTVSGAPATLGTMGNATVAKVGSWQAGISINLTTGAVSTSATVPAGVYSIQYSLCDKSTPPICATTTDTITVVNAAIGARPDSGTADAGVSSIPIPNVVANDTINGTAALLGSSGNATIAKVGTWPSGAALNTATGAVTTSAAVAANTYNLSYKLCDKAPTPVCMTTTATVAVITPSIIPGPDSGTATAGLASTPIISVLTNDTVNGAPAALGQSGNATIAPVGSWRTGIALNTSTGAITTTAAVPTGNYSVQYKLCDLNSTPSCSTATDTISFVALVQAVPESGSAAFGTASTPIPNVAANDSIHGVPATLGPSGNATVAKNSVWNSGIALNTTTGAVTTTASVPRGTYAIAYKVCDRSTPAHCASATDSVTVADSIVAVLDAGISVAGTSSTSIDNVAANDVVNGAPAVLGAAGNATLSPVGSWPAGFALNVSTGALTVDGTVAPGSYPLQYQLCDSSAPSNCSSTTDTLVVTPAFTDVRVSCPLFHCTPEATGVMYQPIVTPTVVTSQNSLGSLRTQGCSSDASTLACIFYSDAVPPGNRTSGLLKVLDPATLAPIWGDAGGSSYVLGSGVYVGEVPYIFPNGQIAAGDSNGYALYNPDGSVDLVLGLDSRKGYAMGLTPLSANYAVISQTTGALTLVDTVNWVVVATLTLKDPSGASVRLVSPSSGSDGVVYAVGQNTAGAGFLFAVDMRMSPTSTLALRSRATFSFNGQTGASPAVVRPNVTGLPHNLILLHAPGLSGDTQNRLLGLLDNGTTFSQLWSIPLTQPLTVAPTIDEIGHTLYYQNTGQSQLFAADIDSGVATSGPFNIPALAGLPANFQLNGHLLSIQTGPTGNFTLLLSGSSRAVAGSTSGGQYVLGFQPSTQQILWSLQTLAQPEQYTEAWGLVPSTTPGLYCLTVVGPTSGISRLCDN